ncbi:MAG TPA: hypothetical protein PK141_05620, partial [Polyangiaceae bacterium]|nr:hypothetical protein [Polyangiaceae bacterium]
MKARRFPWSFLVRSLSLAGAISLSAFPSGARANGRFPATNAIVVAPRDPSFLVLRATYGVLFSRDAGKTWDWVCEQSLGYSGIEDPPIALTERPVVVGAMFGGLAVSDDQGCSFALRKGPLDKRVMNDVTVARGRPREVLALSSSYAGRGDAGGDAGGNLYTSTLFVSKDEGLTFASTGATLDPTVLLETVEATESDPSRVYLSGAREGASGIEGVLLMSVDGGATFTERRVPLVAGERAVFIGAVDPKDPDRLYVRLSGGPDLARGRLLVSDDGGKAFREVWASDGPLTGLALSPDGARVYAGSVKDGLVVADRGTLAFEARAKVQVQCLATAGDRVFACSNERSGFVAGASSDDGRTFAPLLRLAGLRGQLACGASSTTAVECTKNWPRLRDELGIGADGGATSPAPPSPAAPPPPGDSGGCDTVGRREVAGTAGAGVLALAVALGARWA